MDSQSCENLDEARIQSNPPFSNYSLSPDKSDLPKTISPQNKRIKKRRIQQHELEWSPGDSLRRLSQLIQFEMQNSVPSNSQRTPSQDRGSERSTPLNETVDLGLGRQHSQSPSSQHSRSKALQTKSHEIWKCRTVSILNSRKKQKSLQIQQLCSICLNVPSEESGRLPCEHVFCFGCIEFWSNSSSKCPYCRKEFDKIIKRNGQEIVVQKRQLEVYDPDDYIQDPCYVCGTFDSIPTLLLCDGCENRCCHIECDPRIGDQAPEYWLCVYCEEAYEREQQSQRLDLTQVIERLAEQYVQGYRSQASSHPNPQPSVQYYRQPRQASNRHEREYTESSTTGIASRTRSKTNQIQQDSTSSRERLAQHEVGRYRLRNRQTARSRRQ